MENENRRHVSAGAPVMAQTGGKSFAASCDRRTRTLLEGLIKPEPQQLIEAAVEAWL